MGMTLAPTVLSQILREKDGGVGRSKTISLSNYSFLAPAAFIIELDVLAHVVKNSQPRLAYPVS